MRTITHFYSLKFVISYLEELIRMINIYQGAGERIYLTRVMRGYTRESLAELAQISSKFLYEIETGKKGFSAQVLYNICVALRVDSDYILTGKQEISYDKKLTRVLEMFEKEKTNQISEILKDIYKLLEE